MKLGHTAEAQKLLEESCAVTPSNVTVSSRPRRKCAAQSGDDDKAMDYLVSAHLSGHAPGTANQTFEALYKSTQRNFDGLEAMLDTEYSQALRQSGPRGGL